MHTFAVLVTLLTLFLVSANASAGTTPDGTLDAMHAAGGQANEKSYLIHFADDAALLGTDSHSRVEGAQLRDFIRDKFSRGEAWDYRSTGRKIWLSPLGSVAWFDESLLNSNEIPFRGSGVMVRNDAGWQVAQYKLSLSTSNDILLSAGQAVQHGQVPTGNAMAQDSDSSEFEATAEPEKKKRCKKTRHKTNKRASC